MKVILKNEIVGLGEEGEVVTVANGYARNFLFPNRNAVEYNSQNISVLKSQKNTIRKRRDERRTMYMSLKERIDTTNMVIKMKSGESGHLFGAVTSTHIANELEKIGIEIFKKQILVPHHSIKELGQYNIEIKLLSGISALLNVTVEDMEEKKQEFEETPPVPAVENSSNDTDTIGTAETNDNAIMNEEQDNLIIENDTNTNTTSQSVSNFIDE